VTRYLVTVLPGLEPIVADEAAAKLPAATVRETARARVVLEVAAPASALMELRTADNVFELLGEATAGPHRADLEPLGRACAALLPDPTDDDRQTLWVNASRRGAHTYSRFEAAHVVSAALLRRRPRWTLGTAESHSVELRLDVEDDRALLSRRLSPPTFRWRGRERAFAAAALRPPVAHALVWLTRPDPQDVFVDPFCGSGTVLSERAAYPAARIVGGDASPAALEAARQNVAALGTIELRQWDARALPLDGRSVGVVATNLPFGRQVLDASALPELYLAFAREMQRTLTRGGVAVALTERPDVLEQAVERTRLRLERVLALSLKGLRPEVVRLSVD
jgi:tRNA (guanine6-N2)-methyltransferase